MALAQASQHTTDFQVWLDPTVNYNLAPRVRLSNDLYYRTKLNDLQWKQTVVRPGLAYTWSKRVIVLGGVGWFRIKDHDLEARNEMRYWGGVQYTHPLFRKIDLQHYIRIEERVFSQNGYEGYNNLRLRYRLGASYPIKEKDEKGKSAVVLLQYEPFLTVNEGKLNEQFLTLKGFTSVPAIRCLLKYGWTCTTCFNGVGC